MDEIVGIYDEQWHPAGQAPRSRVRAQNLRHAGTGIVLVSSAGRVYVHRRTETKDVFPGLYDVAAGGVMRAGEDPVASAARELAEELGITGVPLEPLGSRTYEDERTRYRAHLYLAISDGPVTWQPEEVAWGDWCDPGDLVAWIERDRAAFVPDSLELLGDWLRARADGCGE